MKFDPGKAWPHPVLRPVRFGDDYPRAEFEVEIQVKRSKANTTVDVDATFELSDPDLLQLVTRRVAQYALLVKAPSTHFRETVLSRDARIAETFPSGTLSGRVEFSPFLICTTALSAFSAAGWHSDFAGRTYDLLPGAVLATDVPKDYWVDTADETHIASIFGHRVRSDMVDGLWRYQLGDDSHLDLDVDCGL
ncbi:MAG: hypothetical protein F4Y74_07715 [Gemmatimonadales bacterium]|nr:hypothetical protein [Gemmatimonadales bacterium]